MASGRDQGGQLPCDNGGRSGSLGGYQPVTDQDEQSSIQKDLAPLAFQNFTSTHTVTGCMANTVKPVAYNITKACKQVVAGTNYAFALSSSYDCTSTSNSPATGAVLLNSIVYQPLPSGGQNAKPQVTRVWNATTS
ncbi:g5474 [Coccomyxa viridis]|uniref:G5474 protein n=1 Tax=Coccomyxa viridis TaxID=1274662 RepID=A0ABP1FZQ8_9CHLO